jgi:acetyl-CoA acyltransferase
VDRLRRAFLSTRASHRPLLDTKAKWIETGAFAIDGRIPVNTSGGQIGRGHPIGATGVAQIAELTHQLRGTAAGMQVDAPRVALAHIAGGVIRFETAAAGAHILVRD